MPAPQGRSRSGPHRIGAQPRCGGSGNGVQVKRCSRGVSMPTLENHRSVVGPLLTQCRWLRAEDVRVVPGKIRAATRGECGAPPPAQLAQPPAEARLGVRRNWTSDHIGIITDGQVAALVKIVALEGAGSHHVVLEVETLNALQRHPAFETGSCVSLTADGEPKRLSGSRAYLRKRLACFSVPVLIEIEGIEVASS